MSQNGMETTAMEQDENIPAYAPADKQYPSNTKYTTYESLQTGAMGKVAK
jgi:hypothetical protein